MNRLITFLNWLFWKDGFLASGRRAKKHRITGKIVFLLWNEGDKRGGAVPLPEYWHKAGDGHEFIPASK
jgi:hypothetical protein